MTSKERVLLSGTRTGCAAGGAVVTEGLRFSTVESYKSMYNGYSISASQDVPRYGIRVRSVHLG